MPIIWLRRLIRRKFRPVDTDVAVKWKQYLSAAYAFASMNLFLLVVYSSSVKKAEVESYTAKSLAEKAAPARKYANLLGINEAVVVKVSGTNVTTYNIKKEDKKVDEDLEDDI